GGPGGDGEPRARRRQEPARPRRGAGGGVRVRRRRTAEARLGAGLRAARARSGALRLMEALVLAGGRAERLGDAAQGLPKPLVPVAGFPLAGYTVARLVSVGVERVVVVCRAGVEVVFEGELGGLGVGGDGVGAAGRLGRGGGRRHGASL